MNKLYKVVSLLIIASWGLISCGEDEPENLDNSQNGNETETSSKPSDSMIERIVRSNITCSASYSDYTFTFKIKSTVKSKLPSADVKYGIGHGTILGSTIENVSLESQVYDYSSSIKGDVESITITNPFWFYYVFTETDKHKWAECEMYYKSYIALKDKNSPLSSDEKDLYNSIKKILDEHVRDVKYSYKPSVYVCVNDKFYKLNTYHIP